MEVYCMAFNKPVDAGDWWDQCGYSKSVHLFEMEATCLAADEAPPNNFVKRAMAECGMDPLDEGADTEAADAAWRFLNVDRWALQWAQIGATGGLDLRERRPPARTPPALRRH